MKRILAKELKIKFIEALNEVDGFSYEDGNPFFIKLGKERYFVFLKNISPAYFVNSPDVTRVQLPYSDHFKKVTKANIPFVILGYDADYDTLVSWNPRKIKERLNTKSNVSLYSRSSLQKKVVEGEFKAGYLSNGERIILFNRILLPKFFERWSKLFRNAQIEIEDGEVEQPPSKFEEEYETDKIYEIRDKDLIAELKPLLRKNRVLEAVEICTKHYGAKYKSMLFKDWFKVVKDLYEEVSA